MSGHEAFLGFEYLNTTLTGDATLTAIVPAANIKRACVPPETVPPYIIYDLQAGTDVLTLNAVRLMSNLIYQVKVVGPANVMDALLAQAAARIDDLLKRVSGIPLTVDGLGAIIDCHREAPLIQNDLINTVVWTSAGGLYRLFIQQMS